MNINHIAQIGTSNNGSETAKNVQYREDWVKFLNKRKQETDIIYSDKWK